MNEKMDVLCSHAVCLENIERDFTTIANTLDAVGKKTGVVSSFISSLHERINGIRPLFGHKADEIRKVKKSPQSRKPKSGKRGERPKERSSCWWW